MNDPDDDDEPKASQPYRERAAAAGAPAAESGRRVNARKLAALAAISAAHGEDATSQRLRERAALAKDDEIDRAREKARAFRRSGHAAFRQGQFTPAESQYRAALAIHEELGAPLVDDLVAVATTLRLRGAWAPAEVEFRRATRLGPVAFEAETPSIMAHDLGVLLVHLGRWNEAENIFDRALRAELDRGTAAYGSEAVARLRHAYAESLLDVGQTKAASGHITKAMSVREARTDHPALGSTLATMARVEHAEGRLDAAAQTYARALPLLPQDAIALQVDAMRGALLFDRGRQDEALALVEDTLRKLELIKGEGHPSLCRALRTRERFMRALGRADAADSMARRIARIVEPWNP